MRSMSGGATRTIVDTFELYKSTERALGTTDFSDRLIHYTTIETLAAILASRTLRFGNLSEMNDPSECDHFADGLIEGLLQFKVKLDRNEIRDQIEKIRDLVRCETYASSWCEYFYTQPDGKLEMWREYGDHGQGVGIVVDSSDFLPSNLTPSKINFAINSTRVAYIPRSVSAATDLANDMVQRLSRLSHFRVNPWTTMQLATLVMAKSPCVKHDGYALEEEIRFLHFAGLRRILPNLADSGADLVKVIQPAPNGRRYVDLPLSNYPQYGFDLSPERLLKRIVIGPSGDSVRRAAQVRSLLDEFLFSHTDIHISQLPMR